MPLMTLRCRMMALLLLLLALAGCGEPVPNAKLDYVGTWRADTVLLEISPDGRVVYQSRPSANSSKSLDAPIAAFEGDNFSVGVGPFKTTFVVSAPPHQEDGVWKMTVDGEVLTRE